MFIYKDISFYNRYFGSLEDFVLSEPFKEVSDKNIYMGFIEARDSVHPLIIQIEIPKNFPHQKMMFWTESLYGYPHLIDGSMQGHKGSWFCLNTPFAETPEEQLAQEMQRLRGWMKQQLREDLPSIIKDPLARRALALANAYDWEIQNVEDNLRNNSILSFIEYEALDLKKLKRNGVFHCVSNSKSGALFINGFTEESFFVINNNFKQLNCKEIPYVIEERWPSTDILTSFFRLKEFYNWSNDLCEKLLPDYQINDEFDDSYNSFIYESMDDFRESFTTDITKFNNIEEDKQRSNIPAKYREMVFRMIDSMKKRAEDKTNPNSLWNKPFSEWTEEDYYNEDMAEYYFYEMHYFILGIKGEDNIEWIILGTNHNEDQFERLTFKVGEINVVIRKKTDVKLPVRSVASKVDYKHFFGRGTLCPVLSEKKIAIIGAGAIGSIVAESLAKGGFLHLEIWDQDCVEPGNLCRSVYSFNDLGNNKAYAICSHIKSTNSFCKAYSHNSDLYGRINYQSQDQVRKELHSYDLIIDCTASNELLHFMSYAILDIPIISLSITNHAQNLLCISNSDGNAYAIRKLLLSKIEQDTKNYYVEGIGCYSPTFLASYADIISLVNLAIRDICLCYTYNKPIHSTVWSYADRGVLSEKMLKYKLRGKDIILIVSNETLLDAEDLPDRNDGTIGYLLGGYSSEGKQIVITHFIPADGSEIDVLNEVFKISEGNLDYIGDYQYSGEYANTYSPEYINVIAAKAENKKINTNNPMLAVRNPDGSVSFFLYLSGELIPFELEN